MEDEQGERVATVDCPSHSPVDDEEVGMLMSAWNDVNEWYSSLSHYESTKLVVGLLSGIIGLAVLLIGRRSRRMSIVDGVYADPLAAKKAQMQLEQFLQKRGVSSSTATTSTSAGCSSSYSCCSTMTTTK
jgi:hypothetical protein